MDADGLTELDVVEAIVNAVAIHKRLRSTSARSSRRREYLYVIEGTNRAGMAIYTTGKIVRQMEADVYYFLISSKRSD